MQQVDSSFESKEDPGGARFGNFINYYDFNPPENRLRLLPSDLITRLFGQETSIAALDIGSNSGNLTVDLHSRYTRDDVPLFILGVDVDPQLVARAVEHNRNNAQVKFATADVMSPDMEIETIVNNFLQSINKKRLDIVFVFSVSMWIHLHHGDEGLSRFLRLLSKLANTVVLEPQPWKCYQTAARRMRKLNKDDFPYWKEIAIRGEKLEPGILDIARTHNLHLVETFGETKWNRKLLLLQTKD